MYKALSMLLLLVSVLLQSSCGSVKTERIQLSDPPFSNVLAFYNTYTAGVQGGGTGIEFHMELGTLPDGVVLERVYFKNNTGTFQRNGNNFTARLRTDQDVIMSSDPKEEAANIPPQVVEQFPFDLEEGQAGILYTEKGELKYTKIVKVEKRDAIAYPGAPPRDGGH